MTSTTLSMMSRRPGQITCAAWRLPCAMPAISLPASTALFTAPCLSAAASVHRLHWRWRPPACSRPLGDFDIDPVEMALLGQKAENQFVGVNSGILDQYSSTMGEAGSSLLLDCRYLSSRLVHIDPRWLVVICDTRAERNLTGSEYSDRRAQCEAGVAILAAVRSGHQGVARCLVGAVEGASNTCCRTWWNGAVASSSRKTSACWIWPKRCRSGTQIGCAI